MKLKSEDVFTSVFVTDVTCCKIVHRSGWIWNVVWIIWSTFVLIWILALDRFECSYQHNFCMGFNEFGLWLWCNRRMNLLRALSHRESLGDLVLTQHVQKCHTFVWFIFTLDFVLAGQTAWTTSHSYNIFSFGGSIVWNDHWPRRRRTHNEVILVFLFLL